MHDFRGSLGDEIWRRLKDWARTRAGSGALTADDCVPHVVGIIRDLTGYPDTLGSEAIAFYASEAAEMVAKSRGVSVRA
ncbi:MAG TPA: hypothetical protein VMD47_05575 [Candidatus Acidoferrales bacterium]|nr:hypothetical protein [Candidatus Acidoferrales bacterium]